MDTERIIVERNDILENLRTILILDVHPVPMTTPWIDVPVVIDNDAAHFRVLCACGKEHAILCIVDNEVDELRSRCVDTDTLAASLIAGVTTSKERTHRIRVSNFEIAIDHIGTVRVQHMTT